MYHVTLNQCGCRHMMNSPFNPLTFGGNMYACFGLVRINQMHSTATSNSVPKGGYLMHHYSNSVIVLIAKEQASDTGFKLRLKPQRLSGKVGWSDICITELK